MPQLSSNSVVSAGKMRMPVLGFGSWLATPEEIEASLDSAFEIGYRHIDTAYIYQNEAAIGKTLDKWFKSGRLKREDVFVTTKLPSVGNRAEDVDKYISQSLDALKLSYVDLYLIHFPVGLKKGDDFIPVDGEGKLIMDPSTDLLALWKAMEKQVELGRTKSIGLSNCNAEQVERILNKCTIKPANNQIEMNIYLQQPELNKVCNDLGVPIAAYAPLGSPGMIDFKKQHGFKTDELGNNEPMKDPVVIKIAEKHKKTPSQVLIRFLLQRGVAVLVKSKSPDRIKQNFSVFDFELSAEDMKLLTALDRGEDGRTYWVQGFFTSLEKHHEYPFKR